MTFGWQIATLCAFTTLTTVAAITVTTAAFARLALLALFRRIGLAFRWRLQVAGADSGGFCACHDGYRSGVKVLGLSVASRC